jgi:hypothetical protein
VRGLEFKSHTAKNSKPHREDLIATTTVGHKDCKLELSSNPNTAETAGDFHPRNRMKVGG